MNSDQWSLAEDPGQKPLSSGVQIGPYRIEVRLGEGGMGTVYRAVDTKLNRPVAIKFLRDALADAAARRRFQREAQMASSLNHPHILTVYDVGEFEERQYIVTEFVDGGTLKDWAKSEKRTWRQCVELLTGVADGLAAAHGAGILHRDIKPANILVAKNGYAKLADFGLAKLSEEKPPSPVSGDTLTLAEGETRPGVIVGTVAYMSPEQASGLALGARSDIFSFGVVLYELLAGRRPFSAKNELELLKTIVHGAPEPLPEEVPGALRLAVEKALEKDPAARHQSMREFVMDLRRLRHGAEAPTAARPRVPVRGLAWAAVVLLVLAAVAYAIRGRFAGAGVQPAERITLAILPLRATGLPEELRFLSVGIADSVITRLATVRQLLPRPTSAVLKYENQNADPSEAGRTLASEYVMTGLLQQNGQRLRVSVQLVRTKDGAPIWGKQYEVARTDLLNLQDNIAGQVAEALKIQMTAAERARFVRRYTENQAANELYLRGRSELSRANEEGSRASIASFKEALRLDPNYPLARAGIAMASASMALRFANATESPQWAERAKSEAQAVLASHSDIAEAHEALAAVYRSAEFDWDRTIEESTTALDLNPTLDQPHYYRAVAFYHLGLLEQAEQDVRAGLEVNPGNRSDAARTRGRLALYSGRFEESAGLLEELKRVTRGTTYDGDLAFAYYYRGEHERAEQLLAPLRGGSIPDRRAQAQLASFLGAGGRRAEAETLLRAIIQGGYTDHHVAYNVGTAYAGLGNFTEARRWLRQAAETGLPNYPWFESDPLLAPIRKDAEFQAFLSELKKSFEATQQRYARGSR